MQNQVRPIFLFHYIYGVVEIAPTALFMYIISRLYAAHQFPGRFVINRDVTVPGNGYKDIIALCGKRLGIVMVKVRTILDMEWNIKNQISFPPLYNFILGSPFQKTVTSNNRATHGPPGILFIGILRGKTG